MEQSQYDTLEIYGYSGYTLATRQELEHISSSIQARIVTIRDSLMEIGEMLTKARELVKHGEWGAWLHANFQWSESTARNYMNVVSTFSKSATVADLENINTAALYMLASPRVPEPAREQALEEARAGVAVTKARVKEIIATHTPPAPDTTAGVVWAADDDETEYPLPEGWVYMPFGDDKVYAGNRNGDCTSPHKNPEPVQREAQVIDKARKKYPNIEFQCHSKYVHVWFLEGTPGIQCSNRDLLDVLARHTAAHAAAAVAAHAAAADGGCSSPDEERDPYYKKELARIAAAVADAEAYAQKMGFVFHGLDGLRGSWRAKHLCITEKKDGYSVVWGLANHRQFSTEEDMLAFVRAETAETAPAVDVAEPISNELSPIAIASKINRVGFALAKYAYEKMKESAAEENRDIDFMNLSQHYPNDDEMLAVVEEYYNMLFADIQQGLIFSSEVGGCN